jgi:hypothetical protein
MATLFCPRWLSSGTSQQRPRANVLVDTDTAVAVLFCSAAKGIVMGTPLIQICYSGLSLQEQGIITVPAVLYQGFQIVFGQISVKIIKDWKKRVDQAGNKDVVQDTEKGAEISSSLPIEAQNSYVCSRAASAEDTGANNVARSMSG